MLTIIEALPGIRLGFFPTPLTEARHLSSVLGGPRIIIKREDLNGLALGGNKCRKLEFILAEAKRQGADATDELVTQLKEQNIEAHYVVLANGGGRTQAGLFLGSKYLGAHYQVIGISVLRNRDDAIPAVVA